MHAQWEVQYRLLWHLHEKDGERCCSNPLNLHIDKRYIDTIASRKKNGMDHLFNSLKTYHPSIRLITEKPN